MNPLFRADGRWNGFSFGGPFEQLWRPRNTAVSIIALNVVGEKSLHRVERGILPNRNEILKTVFRCSEPDQWREILLDDNRAKSVPHEKSGDFSETRADDDSERSQLCREVAFNVIIDKHPEKRHHGGA